MRARAWGGWGAAALWLVARCCGPQQPVSWSLTVGHRSLAYLHVDWTWLLLLLAVLVLRTVPVAERTARIALVALSSATFIQYVGSSLTRYYAGHARAWDLANYAQPMWRAAHGWEMSAGVHNESPIWADHGAFAMFLYAPLTRIAADAGTGLLVAQALIVAVGCFAAYELGRALSLSVSASLAVAVFHASSRPLSNAVGFDFHPECAFPLLMMAVVATRTRGRWTLAVLLTLLACTLREMAALTIGALWTYWALQARCRRHVMVAGSCFLVAAIDIVALPHWTGSYHYLAQNAGSALDVGVALETTLMRALATGLLGWLHPIAWVMGMPWIAAAGTASKLDVKGIDFQYSFLFVPVATIGAAEVLRLLTTRRPSIVAGVVIGWLSFTVATNGVPSAPFAYLPAAHRWFTAIHQRLSERMPPQVFVSVDACAAPYAMERAQLGLLCKLEGDRLRMEGVERWESPVQNALSASYLLVRRDCSASGPCAATQLAVAQQRAGFKVIEQVGPFAILARVPPVQR